MVERRAASAASATGRGADPALPARCAARLLIVGVGGQGVISLARLVGQAALEEGLDVRVGQLHGMSQRGGSVEATVALGAGETAFVSRGQADVLLALEPLEAARAAPRLAPGCLVWIERTPIAVPGVRALPGPDELLAPVTAVTERVYRMDAGAAARDAGAPRSANVVMLGAVAASGALPIGPDALRRVVAQARPAALAGFDRGLRIAEAELGGAGGAP
ncbi:MAG TPA: 2-oxoacid:acceptor oxidoreductase family protein [Planctomycetota bacterium]|nr:2-oxoacid:acceptor oxidoreductase family protein [Planctomycetota bacterium]